MAKLNMSLRAFIGAIVYVAEEAAGTADLTTLPVSGSALWKEMGAVQSLTHKPIEVTEKTNEVGASGWYESVDVFTVGDMLTLKTREISELYERLSLGVSAPLVAGAAQTPFANPNRKIRAWIKFQHRMSTGTDRRRMDVFCELRLKDDPAVERKIPEPVYELIVVSSTLASVMIPA